MNIQRWHDDGRCFRDPEGEWVAYADHVAAVEAMREACIAVILADGLGAEWRVERVVRLLKEIQP